MTTTKPRTQNSVVPAYVPKAPDAIMAELWAVKRQANAAAHYDVRTLLQRIVRETEDKLADLAPQLKASDVACRRGCSATESRTMLLGNSVHLCTNTMVFCETDNRLFKGYLMSNIKRMMEDQMDQEMNEGPEIVLKIAIDSGVLMRCTKHVDCIYRGSEKIEKAHSMLSSKLAKGEFADRITVSINSSILPSILRDTVKRYSFDSCPICSEKSD